MAPALVRQKIMPRLVLRARSRKSKMNSVFPSRAQMAKRWSMSRLTTLAADRSGSSAGVADMLPLMRSWMEPGGKVAEKSQVLRRMAGELDDLLESCFLKPMLSISSASSSTTITSRNSSVSAICARSDPASRPGVATTIWVGRFSASVWRSMLSPPLTTSMKILAVYLV
jgi:hypothetical protein